MSHRGWLMLSVALIFVWGAIAVSGVIVRGDGWRTWLSMGIAFGYLLRVIVDRAFAAASSAGPVQPSHDQD